MEVHDLVGAYLPHGHCFFWNPTILGISVISDSLIALSYFSIPPLLLYLSGRRRDVLFQPIFVIFSLFIFSCGTTHLIDMINVWNGYYLIGAIAKGVTAVASVTAAVLLVRLMPKALTIPSLTELLGKNDALKIEIESRKRAQLELLTINSTLQEHARAAEDLQKDSTENFKLLADIIPHLVWATNERGEPDYFNSRWEQFTGLSAYDCYGSKWAAVVHPEDRTQVERIWRHCVNTGESYEVAYRLKSHDGNYYKFAARAQPLKKSDGQIVRWFGTCSVIGASIETV